MEGTFNLLKQNKVAVVFALMMGLMVAMTGLASASTGPDATTVASMTSAFGGIKDTALAALAAIAGIAILLFGAIYAWRYGKKVFSIIAK